MTAAAVLIFAAAALGAAAAQAAAPTLAVPVECAIGAACVVQNHVDHEPGPSARAGGRPAGAVAYTHLTLPTTS